MKIETSEVGSFMQPVIFKVGGASLTCANDIKELPSMLRKFKPLALVISAFKAVTTQLTGVVHHLNDGKPETAQKLFAKILFEHYKISRELDLQEKEFFKNVFREFKERISEWEKNTKKQEDVDNFILAQGEILSSRIVWAFLQKEFGFLKYVDAREVVFLGNQAGYQINRTKTSESLMEILKKNQPFLIAGFIAAENRNLGRNGSDTTLALVADSIHKIGQKPRVIYLKAEAFDMSNLKEKKEYLSYGQFGRAMRGKSQPYVHEDAIRILAELEIPFEVWVKSDTNFRLSVGCPKQNLTHVVEKKQITTAAE